MVVLVPTVTSVHRLAFPHPCRLERSGLSRRAMEDADENNGGLMSVLSDASVTTAREYEYHINFPSACPLPHLAASYYTHDDESVFVLGMEFISN